MPNSRQWGTVRRPFQLSLEDVEPWLTEVIASHVELHCGPRNEKEGMNNNAVYKVGVPVTAFPCDCQPQMTNILSSKTHLHTHVGILVVGLDANHQQGWKGYQEPQGVFPSSPGAAPAVITNNWKTLWGGMGGGSPFLHDEESSDPWKPTAPCIRKVGFLWSSSGLLNANLWDGWEEDKHSSSIRDRISNGFRLFKSQGFFVSLLTLFVPLLETMSMCQPFWNVMM